MKKPKTNYSKQGKLNRAAGRRFEAKVRGSLEKMGWIVDKWTNTIEQEKDGGIWKLAPAKPKFIFNPKIKRMIPLGIGLGFPDFIAFKQNPEGYYEIVAVEVKANGYLDKKERSMCNWLTENKIFSKILIARKKENGRKIEIEYKEFEHNNS